MIPEFTTLTDWAASLVVDFPLDNIPFLKDESVWKEWGNTLIRENSFAENGAPGTGDYSSWKPWAVDIYKVMLNVA
jgi:hypothetical protein